MQDAYQHCQALVRERERDRFLATLFAPSEERKHLFALYAFDLEIARVPDAVREPMAGEIRLQWWRDVIVGDRAGEAQANPVSAALLDTVHQHRLPVEVLQRAIDARDFDLIGSPMATRAALNEYLDDTIGPILSAAARVLAPDWDATDASCAAGRSIGIVKLLQNIGRDVARGRLFVPLDLLAEHGVHTASVFAAEASTEIREAINELCIEADRYHRSLRELKVPQSAIPIILPAALIPASLARIRRVADPFRASTELSGLRSQFLLWRAARRGAI